MKLIRWQKKKKQKSEATVAHLIRKAQLKIDDSIYWIIFAVLLVISIFPGIAVWASKLLGIKSPANFVFLAMIFLVLIKLFQVSIDLPIQRHRLNHLVQKLALLNWEQDELKKSEEPSKEQG
ncbi:MAG: DUF2304 domain-containing protein [Clostridia bacterium]|nr:DUF2304 domain-containing protein [Clostridia bacterium]